MPEEIQTPTGTDPVPPVTPEPVEPAAVTPPAVDYEKKFADSTRENQILQARLAEEERKRQESTKEPTDSEYRAAFPDWDLLDDSQKSDKRRILNAERTSFRAEQIARELQSERSWNTSLELAIASTPALQGKEDAFKKFASKPQYKDVPMELLVSSFLGTQSVTEPPKPTPKPGLETGQGGPKETPKPKSLSMDDLEALRKSDYKAYEAYIKTHPIEFNETE